MMWSESYWIYGLIGVLLLLFWSRFKLKSNEKAFSKMFSRDIWKIVHPEFSLARSLTKSFLVYLSLGFLLLALAGPRWGYREETTAYHGMDIMIAVDVSRSMDVEDVVPSRLKKAKHFLKNLLGSLRGDRVGVIAFAGSGFLASPLTTDLSYITEVVETLDTRSISNQGTDIGLALQISSEALERGAEEQEKQRKEDPATKAVILISDGEDLEGAALEGAKRLKQSGVELYVVGVGTTKGKPIPVRNNRGRLKGYKKDGSGKAILSRFDPAALKKLAQSVDGRYWDMSPEESEVRDIVEALGGLNRTQLGERTFKIYEERYQVPLFFAILFLIWEMILRRRVRPVATALSLILVSSTSFAKEPTFDVYRENKKGVESFEGEDIESAKKHFGNAQAKDPDSMTLRYNQSIIQGAEEDWESATEGFAESYENAENDNTKLKGRALYNWGSSLAEQNKDQEAIQKLIESIDHAKKHQNKELEETARNRIQQIIQKRKQQQKQKQQQQQDQQQSKNDQKENQDPKPDDQEDEKKEQPQRYSQKKQFKSEKLSKEDAERVMADLANREKQLKMRLRKKQSKEKKARRKKDW